MYNTQAYISGNRDEKKTLVVVFLRGAADGLNMVVPHGDDDYYRARPTIGISKSNTIKLDDFFGLNPALGDLISTYEDGDMAVVHAAGSEDSSRSHFEAQDLMEHAGLNGGGWLARYLRYRPGPRPTALSAIAIGPSLPESLRGAPSATAFESLSTFSMGDNSQSFIQQLKQLYSFEKGDLGEAANDTFEAIARVATLKGADYKPANAAIYGNDGFSNGLMQISQLIKARVGLEAASIDLDGWDSHFAQSALMDPLMTKLSHGLANFRKDLGKWMEHVTIVVMTEFGRRVAENSALGTDHGRGSAMFILGGGIRGGRVLTKWPGLKNEGLEGPGDLPVTTNYRSVLAPILNRHGAENSIDRIFPNFPISPFSLYS